MDRLRVTYLPSSIWPLYMTVCTVWMVGQLAVAAPRYKLEQMVSPLYPDDASHATDINDNGNAIVSFYNRGYAGSWYSYIWNDGQVTPIYVGYGLRINNHNQVTGYGGFQY